MLIYVLICLLFSLIGIVGLQLFYMFYLEGMSKEHKKRIRQLEAHCTYLIDRLKDAETQIIENEELIQSEIEKEKEVWADVIEE